MLDSLSQVDRLTARLERYLPPRTARTPQPTDDTLQAFIASSHELEAPAHLKPLTDVFERVAAGETVRALISTPPQHGKSQTVLHALVWLLLRDPTKRHAYATYAQQFSRDQSWLASLIATSHGLALERDTQDRWNTQAGGGVVWTSRGGPLTGHPVDGLLVIDDLIKDREEANSKLIRDKALGWLSSVAFSRQHPGSSFVMIATRWHLDDPTGRLLESGGYEYIKLPAVTDAGALWPSQRPLAWLESQRKQLLPGDWSALYMCEPIADGARVFGPTTLYDDLPTEPYREAHGYDAAYTVKTTSDWTVTLTGRLIGERLYLTNLIRARAEPMEYIPLMRAHDVQHVHWYASSTERGLAELLKREGVRVTLLPTVTDKLARAIPAATAWNRGDILTPANASWRSTLESELSQFTGAGDAHDDIVDALAALHYALAARQKPMTREARRQVAPW